MLNKNIENEIKTWIVESLANNPDGTWESADEFINDSDEDISQFAEKIQTHRENYGETLVDKDVLEQEVREYYDFVLGNCSCFF